MPCCTLAHGNRGCEIQHKKGDRGVVGCRINLGIYDLLICTSLNLNRSVARLPSSVPPGVILLPRTIEKRCIFLSSLTAGKCSLHYSSECSWGTGAVETEGESERERRKWERRCKERDARRTQKGEGHARPSHKKVCYSSEGFIFVLHYTAIPQFSAYCSREEKASAHEGVWEEAVFMNIPPHPFLGCCLSIKYWHVYVTCLIIYHSHFIDSCGLWLNAYI